MGHKGNITPEAKARLEAYRQDKLWSEWLGTLHPVTRRTYESHLSILMGYLKLTPTELINRAGNPNSQKELSKQVKIVFASLIDRYSSSARNNMLAALRHFLALNEIQLPLIGLKIKHQRTIKPLMTWDEAERVINRCHIEYQPVYQFMLWSGMDRERFSQLNGDPDRIQQVKQQLRDHTIDWIRIDVLKGRKSAPPFYCLVPRRIAELLPICDQAGRPIVAKNNIVYAWMMGMKRAGFTDPRYRRFGPHNLRSVWLSEAQRRKLDPVLMQHQLGHIVDALNYQRIQQDDQWAIGEFRRAWVTQPLATQEQLKARDKTIEEAQEKMAMLEKQASARDKGIKDLRIEIKRMQIREIEKRFNMGTAIQDIEIPHPEPAITDEQEETRREEMKDYQEYKEGQLADLARLKKELATLESG